MFYILLLTTTITSCLANANQDTADTIVYTKHRDGPNYHGVRYDDNDDQKGYSVKLHDDDNFRGPVILRTNNLHNNHGHVPDIEKQNKIIAEVFSPDYHQPTLVLDYRYMKTGGRDYTRGPGGQIIILPRNVHTDESKEFRDFDSLLEHLRLRNLAKKSEYKWDTDRLQNREPNKTPESFWNAKH